MSIRTRQPKTLDSIECQTFPGMGGRAHTFPGMGGRTFDILLHNSALQLLLVPKVLIEMAAHTNSFIVLCNGVESDFIACVCTTLQV